MNRDTLIGNSGHRVMGSPRRVEIDLTSRCNLRCRYCYFYDHPEIPYKDLPATEWRRFFSELGDLAVLNVVLAGGEPFLRQDLPAIITGIVRNRMRYALLSNGTLISRDTAAFIARTGHCDYVQVSIDGSGPRAHDAGREAGSFQAAVRGIRILQEQGIRVTARVTIHRHNLHDLEATVKLLLDRLGLETVGTNSVEYLGTGRRNSRELMLNTRDRQEAMETLQKLRRKYRGRIVASAGPLYDLRTWTRMEAARAAGAPPFSRGGRLTACGSPFNKIAVRSDGVIIPCSLLPHVELGRINQDALKDIWLSHPELNALRQRREIPLDRFEFCSGCEYLPYCTGNCPASACNRTGKIDHPNPDACLRRYLESGGQIPQL